MIVFTELKHPDRPNSQEIYWRAEYYCDNAEMRNFPVGVAYAVSIPGYEHKAQLNFIMVADQWRREGIAGEIIKECLGKWPDLQFTSGMDHRGESLVAKYIGFEEE